MVYFLTERFKVNPQARGVGGQKGQQVLATVSRAISLFLVYSTTFRECRAMASRLGFGFSRTG